MCLLLGTRHFTHVISKSHHHLARKEVLSLGIDDKSELQRGPNLLKTNHRAGKWQMKSEHLTTIR